MQSGRDYSLKTWSTSRPIDHATRTPTHPGLDHQDLGPADQAPLPIHTTRTLRMTTSAYQTSSAHPAMASRWKHIARIRWREVTWSLQPEKVRGAATASTLCPKSQLQRVTTVNATVALSVGLRSSLLTTLTRHKLSMLHIFCSRISALLRPKRTL